MLMMMMKVIFASRVMKMNTLIIFSQVDFNHDPRFPTISWLIFLTNTNPVSQPYKVVLFQVKF